MKSLISGDHREQYRGDGYFILESVIPDTDIERFLKCAWLR